MRVPAYILAGGRSSRFGSDKARAILGGEPLILRLARTVQPVASRMTVVAEVAEKYGDLDLRTIADLRPGLGPLGGLETALADARCEWVLLLSCDLVVLRERWIKMLLERAREDVDVVAFKGERWHPAPGLYRASLLETVREQIDHGELAMWKLIERARHVAAPLPPDWPAVAQANTPAELERARAALDRE